MCVFPHALSPHSFAEPWYVSTAFWLLLLTTFSVLRCILYSSCIGSGFADYVFWSEQIEFHAIGATIATDATATTTTDGNAIRDAAPTPANKADYPASDSDSSSGLQIQPQLLEHSRSDSDTEDIGAGVGVPQQTEANQVLSANAEESELEEKKGILFTIPTEPYQVNRTRSRTRQAMGQLARC